MNFESFNFIGAMSLGLKSTYLDYLHSQYLIDDYSELSIYYKKKEFEKLNNIFTLLTEGKFNSYFNNELEVKNFIEEN